MQDQQHFFC